MNLELENKIAFVAGSSEGLGLATALELAREKARVILTGRSIERLETAAQKIRAEISDAKLFLCPLDLTDEKQIDAAVEKAAKHFGGIDILITNAGGPPAGKFDSLNEEKWATAFQLTLMSVTRLIHSALPWLHQSDCASILTINSTSAKQPLPGLFLSNTFRPAILGLCKTLSQELAPSIRVNSILPGWAATQRSKELLAHYAKTNSTTIEQEIARIASDIPLGRIAEPVEIAKAAVFLVSPAASYLTGVMLSVDGGRIRGLF